MSMERSLFLFSFFFFLLALVDSRQLKLNEPSAYELLESFGFPAGLLPHTVVDYSLNKQNGRFHLQLNETCSSMLQHTYLVKYHPSITGTVRYQSIKSLKGISVRAFYIDWGITGIQVNGNNLLFDVGIGSRKFPLDNFNDSPQCQGSEAHPGDGGHSAT